MADFKGFPDIKVPLTPVPEPFFNELLPHIDNLGELKVTLYVFWKLNRLEGKFRYLRQIDFSSDSAFMAGMGTSSQAAQQSLDDALERAVRRGTLLRITLTSEKGEDAFYFLNSPKGRLAAEAIRNGEWRRSDDHLAPVELGEGRPNIFRLYEENIGPLTPLIADVLREAEEAYPPLWIEEAFRIAVENNVRRWRYIEAILRSWKEEGRDEQTRGDTEKDRQRYIKGKYSEFIEHG